MTTKFKLLLETAIEDVLCKSTENGTCGEYYHHTQLVRQMTNADEMVYDACQDAQEFYEEETYEE